MTLRTRLAWTYGIAIAVVVAVVAIVSVVAIDRALRSALDARLNTTASAIAALVDVRNGNLVFDAEDREQMLDALSPAMSGAIFTRSGGTFVSSAALIPVAIASAARRSAFMPAPETILERGAQLRAVCRPIARSNTAFGYACVWASASYIDDVDRDALIAIALAAVLAGGIVVVLSATLARRALAPLQAFSNLATEIEAHDLSQRVRHGGDDELGRLGSAFDRMLDRLESAFARQRRFTADASHELRAPLAVIRAEADTALQQERAPQQYQEALHTIIAEVERVDAIVDALLLAARADSARLHFEPVDLSALASLVAERFAGAAAQRGVAIDVSGGQCTVMADPATLERALAAILHNGLDFATHRVELRVACDGPAATLQVLDDGPGFSADGLEHATQRFWREAAGNRSGTGLGLAIAEAILGAHGGELRLANRAEGGAAVTVTIPRSS
jgi:signal transduction histidine kinase